MTVTSSLAEIVAFIAFVALIACIAAGEISSYTARTLQGGFSADARGNSVPKKASRPLRMYDTTKYCTVLTLLKDRPGMRNDQDWKGGG